MKLLGVVIVHSFQYLDSASWNPWFVPLVVSFVILCPLVYKLTIAKCIMLFTNF
jgi:hypothetical protein